MPKILNTLLDRNGISSHFFSDTWERSVQLWKADWLLVWRLVTSQKIIRPKRSANVFCPHSGGATQTSPGGRE
jgi:hypothetical protein